MTSSKAWNQISKHTLVIKFKSRSQKGGWVNLLATNDEQFGHDDCLASLCNTTKEKFLSVNSIKMVPGNYFPGPFLSIRNPM